MRTTNLRALLFLALALASATTAVWLARQALNAPAPSGAPVAEEAIELAPVIVASSDLAAGDAIEVGQTEIVQWPAEHLPQGAFTRAALVDGRVLRRALRRSEPVLETDLLPSGSDGGLPALIREDHRAVSVKVDAVVGVAGFVKPGTRVDVIATLRRVDRTRPVPETRVILQDLRVLAIDQTLEERDGGEARTVNVVTLEVSTEDSQKLAYAASEGSLQLALRNPSDGEVRPTRKMSVRDLLASPRAARPAGPQVEGVRGSNVSKESL